ncbi:MAG: amidohydrolase family protein, partial [Candidatus Limnocylindria bacterium]
AAGVAYAVLVQPSAYGPDHRYLLRTVSEYPGRFLPIGLVDPAAADGAAAAVALARNGCVGLRVNLALDLRVAATQAAATAWAAFEALDVPVCVRAVPAHHNLVIGILTRHRRLRLVVDHLGLPEPGHLAAAVPRVAQLATFEHCWLKIAGLPRFSQTTPPYRDTWPLVHTAIQSFGASRLLWGSDFPATDPDLGYAAAIQAIESMPFVGADDRIRLMSGTSRELWGVPVERSTRWQ